jgi:hypothetical protein
MITYLKFSPYQSLLPARPNLASSPHALVGEPQAHMAQHTPYSGLTLASC